MSRMKTFAKYAIWVIAFFIFSNVLIFIGLNTAYSNIEAKSTSSSLVNIQRAEATAVNGRIYGTVTNTAENNLAGKYIRIDVYSVNDNLLGTKFLSIDNLQIGATDNFQIYFKMQNAKKYNVSIVDKVEDTESDYSLFSSEQYREYQIIYWVILLMIIK